jgi:NDP-sugar pyrophosphorylase family protein
MDCVVTAGGMPTEDDPMYAYTQGKPKALLQFGDRTMLERVIDALQDAKSIDNIVVVGLGSDMGMTFKRPVHHLPDQGSLVANTIAGIVWLREQNPDVGVVLASSSDIPLMTADLVDQLIELCQPLTDLVYYTYVTQETMEKRFPDSRRTYVKLKGVEIAGGDLGLLNASVIDSNRELFEALANARKHAWKIAKVVGLKMLIKFLFRRLGPAELKVEAERILGGPARLVEMPFAELAMDADKPEQVDMLRAELVNG